MGHIDPTFFAVIRTGNVHSVVNIIGPQTKERAETHAKNMMVEGQKFVSLEKDAKTANDKAIELNKSVKPGEGIDASTPANVADVLNPSNAPGAPEVPTKGT